MQYVGGTETYLNNTSISPSFPGGIQAGDWLFLLVFSENGIPSATPSGWTKYGTEVASGSGGYLTLFYKQASGSESGTETVSYAGSGQRAAAIVCYRGLDYGVGITDGSSSSNGTSGTSIVTSTLTAAVTNEILISFCGADSGGATTASHSGFNERVEGSATLAWVYISDRVCPSSGSYNPADVFMDRSNSQRLNILIQVRETQRSPQRCYRPISRPKPQHRIQ